MQPSIFGGSRSYYFDIQRRVVANRTMEGWLDAPHASIVIDCDVTRLLESFRIAKQTRELSGLHLTLNIVFLKLIAEAIKCSPDMNAHIKYSRSSAVGSVTQFESINIAIPLRTADGRMVTPVLHNVGELTFSEMCREMEQLRRRVKNTNVDLLLREAGLNNCMEQIRHGRFGVLRRIYANLLGKGRVKRVPRAVRKQYETVPRAARINPEDLTSATVLVSNIGSVLPSMPITIQMMQIISPQTTAIGIPAVVRKPLVVRDAHGHERVEIRDVLPLTLCFDHRVMDLEHILGFLGRVHELLEEPGELFCGESGEESAARLVEGARLC